MILINNACQCDSFSILMVDATCFRCIAGSYKDGVLCTPCIDNCISCTAHSTCLQCDIHYIYNATTNTCQDNNNINTNNTINNNNNNNNTNNNNNNNINIVCK